jgi:hypothetical protein
MKKTREPLHRLKASFKGIIVVHKKPSYIALLLFASVGATSMVLVRDIGLVFNLVGSLLLAYSIYKLGLVASFINKSQDLTKN